MIIIRAISLLLHFTIVPVAVGRLITYRIKDPQHQSPIVTYIIGLFGGLSLFYLLNFGFSWYQNKTMTTKLITGGFTRLCVTYSIIIAILLIIWMIREWRNRAKLVAEVQSRLASLKDSFLNDKLLIVYAILFAGLMLIQMYAAYRYEINEWSYDDYDYVVTSVDDIDSDMITNVNFITGEAPYTSTKRAAQAWTTYVAYLSVSSGFDVTTICHTILPVLLLLIAYSIYYYMARFLFSKSDDRLIFMIILATASVMGMFSHYSPTFRLLCALWQGKAVLTAIVIPFMIAYMARVYSKPLDSRVACAIALFSVGACSLTITASLLMTITTVIMFVLMAVYNRKIYGIRYLIAGMAGPFVQCVMYVCIALLLQRQWEPNFFYNLWNGLIS